jgi:SAM-dependent methyltransferase
MQRGNNYVLLEGGKLKYSSRELLFEVVETNNPIDVFFHAPLGNVRLPFCSAYLSTIDDWVEYLMYSEPHRKLMESMEFAEIAKPFVRWYIRNELNDRKPKVNFQRNNLYAPVVDRLHEVHAPLQYDLVKKVLNPKTDETVLEIGCGTGETSVRLAKDVRSVTGVDRVGSQIAWARKKAEKAGVKNCRFLTADYPYELGQEFDYTIAFNVPFTDEKYRHHLFPSRKILSGGFIRLDPAGGPELNEKALEKVNRSINNLSENYIAHISEEEFWGKLGLFIYSHVAVFERR